MYIVKVFDETVEEVSEHHFSHKPKKAELKQVAEKYVGEVALVINEVYTKSELNESEEK